MLYQKISFNIRIAIRAFKNHFNTSVRYVYSIQNKVTKDVTKKQKKHITISAKIMTSGEFKLLQVV